MSIVYWIEDEIDRLEATRECLRSWVQQISVFATAEEVLANLDQVRNQQGPVILDLWLPRGNLFAAVGVRAGPGLGLWILAQLRERLGPTWPIFVLSGNVDLDTKRRLRDEFQVPLDNIFSKPLNQQNDTLVARVSLAAKEMSGQTFSQNGYALL